MTVHNDTVQHAFDTPELAQPYAELGLKDDEYASIRLTSFWVTAITEAMTIDAMATAHNAGSHCSLRPGKPT